VGFGFEPGFQKLGHGTYGEKILLEPANYMIL